MIGLQHLINACLMLLVSAHLASAAGDLGVSLRETVTPSPLRDLKYGNVVISGRTNAQTTEVRVRVTTSLGDTAYASVPTKSGTFTCQYPRDFGRGIILRHCLLFVDATPDRDFDASTPGHRQAEAALIVYDSRTRSIPDLPDGFTTSLRDSKGRVDLECEQWDRVRTLLNLYMRSKGALVAGVGRAEFDLAKSEDISYYKNSLGLYDFTYRDRDWSTPLRNRVARTFWQSVWRTWFNSSNDHPLDGNPKNEQTSNYLPYVFANDFADILILNLLRSPDGSRDECRDAARNLLAMQHTDGSNFALPDASGKRENYTAGAFRYGMFIDGDFLTEGKGWFYNPRFDDYVKGGVFNGRSIWALGEMLRADPAGPLARQLKQAISLSLKFCLHDSLSSNYGKRTNTGIVYWRDPGEHSYMLLGMLAACRVAPELILFEDEKGNAKALREACVEGLNALTQLQNDHGYWTIYPDVDGMAVTALANGVAAFPSHPDSVRWRAAAKKCADGWMDARVDPGECTSPTIHFGLRTAPRQMTYVWNRDPSDPRCNLIRFYFYQSGHWIHALSRMYAITGDSSYLRRATAMLSYLCGDNPWGVRILNETGGVYNWVEDTDRDGVEDRLWQNMYPESTAFVGIGLMRLLHTLAGTGEG